MLNYQRPADKRPSVLRFGAIPPGTLFTDETGDPFLRLQNPTRNGKNCVHLPSGYLRTLFNDSVIGERIPSITLSDPTHRNRDNHEIIEERDRLREELSRSRRRSTQARYF